VGLDNAGKTVFTNSFRNIYEVTAPTIGLNDIIGEQVNVQDKKINIHIYDMSGKSDLRIHWREKIMEADAIIFVIDSNDVERF
jgi:GTPase SAR1 family protein